MEVETHVFYWTPAGMRESTPLHAFTTTGYVEKREVERLLEAAHEQGWQNAVRAVNAAMKTR